MLFLEARAGAAANLARGAPEAQTAQKRPKPQTAAEAAAPSIPEWGRSTSYYEA